MSDSTTVARMGSFIDARAEGLAATPSLAVEPGLRDDELELFGICNSSERCRVVSFVMANGIWTFNRGKIYGDEHAKRWVEHAREGWLMKHCNNKL